MVQLRGNLTKKMEASAGKVRFRRWKAMTTGARISLVVLLLIVLTVIVPAIQRLVRLINSRKKAAA